MYGGNGGVPPVAGGIVGGGLAYTGFNMTAAILLAGMFLLIGGLLMIRNHYFKVTAP